MLKCALGNRNLHKKFKGIILGPVGAQEGYGCLCFRLHRVILAVITIAGGALDEREMVHGAVDVLTQKLEEPLDLLAVPAFP